VNTSIHLQSGDVSTVDCGLHRNDELTPDYIEPAKTMTCSLIQRHCHPPLFFDDLCFLELFFIQIIEKEGGWL